MKDQVLYARVSAREASRELVLEVYKFTNNLPQKARFKFSADIRKLATMMSSHISDGSSRHNPEEQNQLLLIGYENLLELLTKIIQLHKQRIIDDREYLLMKLRIEDLAQKINKAAKPG